MPDLVNFGITRLAAARDFAGREELLFEVTGPPDSAASVPYEILADDREAASGAVALRRLAPEPGRAARSAGTKAIPVPPGDFALLTIRLAGKDALPLDDAAVLARVRRDALRVAWIGEPEPSVARAIAAGPRVSGVRAAEEKDLAPDAFDLAVFRGKVPARSPAAPARCCRQVAHRIPVRRCSC